MKSNQKNQLPFFTLLFFVLLTASTACRKDPEEIVELITNSEASEIIEDAVASRTAGLAVPTVAAAYLVETYLNQCGVPGDTAFTKVKTGTVASYNYTFGLDWLVTCSNIGVPQSANVGIAGNGTFTSPHWAGTETTTGELVFTGLSPQESSYVVNGAYTLDGNLNGNLRKISPGFDCEVTIALTNLILDKSTMQIAGGSGTATINASSANGQSRTVTGDLVFNGDGSATVEVNGHLHTFEWK